MTMPAAAATSAATTKRGTSAAVRIPAAAPMPTRMPIVYQAPIGATL